MEQDSGGEAIQHSNRTSFIYHAVEHQITGGVWEQAIIHQLPPKYIDKWEEINLGLKDAKKKPMLNDVIKFMQRIICARSDTSFCGEILEEVYNKTFKIANKFQPEQKI